LSASRLEIICEREDTGEVCGYKTVGLTEKQADINHGLHVIHQHPISGQKEQEIREDLAEKWDYDPHEDFTEDSEGRE